jgi:hypothetical protein
MEVKALKTFLNSSTGALTRAGDTLEIPDAYAGDLEKRGYVEQAGATTSATVHGAVPQPQRTAAMAGAPFVGAKSVAGQASASSSSAAGQALTPKTVVTPPPPAKR